MASPFKRPNEPDESPRQISKVATGIAGLDEVLHGGIPKNSMTLIYGGPGAGKTILGLEFLVRGAQSGKPGIMLTFEERETDLRRYAHTFGWDLAALEAQNRLRLISARLHPGAVIAGDFDLHGIFGILQYKAEEIRADRVLIDAPDVFLRMLGSMAKERAEVHVLNEWLHDAGLTTIMTMKFGSYQSAYSLHYEFLEYMADCVIHLDQRVHEQVTTRRLRISKYRGSGFGRNEYPFGVTEQGLRIIPVTQTGLEHRALGDSIPTGVTGLDVILGGGYRRSSCTLITGSSGSGKTTFACSFVNAVITGGERLIYLDFEESWDALVSCMISSGIDLSRARDSGRLRFISAMPESQGVEEHLIQAFRAIDEFQPDHLVVDAISACRRMGSSHASFDYLLRLIDYCKTRGITTLLVNLTSTGTVNEVSGIDLSSVIDTVIILRNVEIQGAYRRELGVLKSRGRRHSNRIHEFQITGRGVRFARKELADA